MPSARPFLRASVVVPLVALVACTLPAPPAGAWRTLQPGLEYAYFHSAVAGYPNAIRLDVVRVDASRVRLVPLVAAEHGGRARHAAQWCGDFHLAAAINLGMFQEDGVTNVGYMRSRARAHNRHWNRYRAALGLLPHTGNRPPVLWEDLEDEGSRERLASYDFVVQNLRLIRRRGRSVWSSSERRWSEAAIGVDNRGRLLFLFCRAPLSPHDFNELVLALPLGVVAAMHVEGGPEASLSVHTGDVEVDLSGSYESGFNENDTNTAQWPIPNVLGVERERR